MLKPADPKETELKLVDLHISPSTPPRKPRTELVTTIKLPKASIPSNIIGSCNGLLCLGLGNPGPLGPIGPIRICNPLLRDVVTLPCPGDRLISLFSCAFGYSPVTDQYKVVWSFQLGVVDPGTDRGTCGAEIYTLGEGSWRSIGEIPTLIYSSSINAFLNGSLHWVNACLIYCFDFGSEQLQAVPEPSEFELPTSFVIDILSRLPIITLFDFRRVCKDWLSLISDPYFANSHLSKSHIRLLLKPSNPEETELKLNLVDLHISPSPPRNARMELVTSINLPKGRNPFIAFTVIGSCNGLLCLGNPYSDGPIRICNPLLRDLVELPNCPSGRSISRFSCAFGNCPLSDQYKVVRSFRVVVVNPMTGRETCEAEIYTLGEGSWRSIGEIPTMVDSSSFNASLNGLLHWVNVYAFIYCFDFRSEQLRVVPEPSEFRKVKCAYVMRVGVLRGCLSICDSSNPHRVEVWVMKDYGVKESWSRDFVIDTLMIDGRFLGYYEPFMVLNDGQILIFGYNWHSILHYDSKSKCLRNVDGYGQFYRGLAHIPSLLLLRDIAKGENFKRVFALTWVAYGAQYIGGEGQRGRGKCIGNLEQERWKGTEDVSNLLTLAAMIMWRIWKCRNGTLFNGSAPEPQQMVLLAVRLRIEHVQAMRGMVTEPRQRSRQDGGVGAVFWQRPAFGKLKINVDGAWVR
ncbi:hypothetical protein RHSIM_Rhsim04G0044400 [Rhododendron simsii]|uniref:F-box domain-containing protein n=1 Tax=Rhododendron simsii TaxID=118357 RepID=A0A834H6T3_RHOSS|nr:hypothetical protein RHSIM_Rhsim04G0044400 [Rhododendron simsii]